MFEPIYLRLQDLSTPIYCLAHQYPRPARLFGHSSRVDKFFQNSTGLLMVLKKGSSGPFPEKGWEKDPIYSYWSSKGVKAHGKG